MYLLPFLAALLAAAPPTAFPDSSLVGRGVSRELAIERARSLSDVRYDLALDVTARDSAVGHVTVTFTRRGNGADFGRS